MARRIENAGIITAYGFAKAGGFIGTEGEFKTGLANSANYASNAQASATAAAGSATSAASSATSATSSKNAAASSATNAALSAADALESAQNAASSESSATTSAISATNNARKSEGYAVGQQNGVDVGSSSPYYHNNSKYYSEQASGSATSASDSASAANTSNYNATLNAYKAEGWAVGTANGEPVGSSSPYYHNNAKYYAEQCAEIDPDTIARIDGYYKSLGAGMAEQLISSVKINDKVPYNFRTTGGNVDVGTVKDVRGVVGGTVAWHQYAPELNSTNWSKISSNVDVSYSSGTATFTANMQYGGIQKAVSIPANRVCLISCWVKATTATNQIQFLLANTSGATISKYATASTEWQQIIAIGKDANYQSGYLRLRDNRTSSWDAVQVKNIQLFDLTQMFGTDIADYIYTLETSTAGAGIAWFKKLFPKDNYSYNAGELKSVKTTAHKTVGFNAYNHTTTFAKLIGGMQYQITGSYTLLSFAPDVGSSSLITPDSNGYFTPSANGTLTVTGGNSTDTCIHLVWDGERDGEYEEYSENVYTLDSSLELRGIPKLDASNNLYYDGDVYAPDGTVTRKFGYIDLGVQAWSGSNGSFSVTLSTIKDVNSVNAVSLICPKYIQAATTVDKSISTNGQVVTIQDSSFSSAATLALALSGVYLVYELATPSTESADPYSETMICDDWGTELFVDAREVAIPVGHNTAYSTNLKAKLEMAPDSPDGDGDYILRQESGINTYVRLTTIIPAPPTTDGFYKLRCVVFNGNAAYVWQPDT